MFKALYLYRNFIFESIKRDFFAKYANSIFGCVWAVIQPLSMILVYAIIFSQVMMAKLPGIDSAFAYSVYLCSGILVWGFFLEISNRLVSIFVENANILKKVKIPKISLPAIVFGSALINFLIIFILFILFLLIIDYFPGLIILYAIPLLCLLSLMALSVGIFLGTINVFFRDITQFYGVLLQFWFWLTPIVYPPAIIPEKFRIILDYNPIYTIIKNFHIIFVEQEVPNMLELLPLTLITIIFSIFVLFFFRKHSEEIVDEL